MDSSEQLVGTYLKVPGRSRRGRHAANETEFGEAAYALSPIDLIPDFIPVLGYLDEVILLPLAIMLADRMIPAPLMAKFRAEADRRSERPVSRIAAAVIIALWIGTAGLLLWTFWPRSAGDLFE